MCRELVGDVLKILTSGNSFVKKKAALAATKMVKKLPDTIEQFISKIDLLMDDRHHGSFFLTRYKSLRRSFEHHRLDAGDLKNRREV